MLGAIGVLALGACSGTDSTDGVGMSLYIKRLEAGKFIWPVSENGSAVPVSAAQLGYLLEGIDWRNPRWTQRPAAAG